MNISQTVTPGAGGALHEHGQMLQQDVRQVPGAHVRTRLQQWVSLETEDLSFRVQYLMHVVSL